MQIQKEKIQFQKVCISSRGLFHQGSVAGASNCGGPEKRGLEKSCQDGKSSLKSGVISCFFPPGLTFPHDIGNNSRWNP